MKCMLLPFFLDENKKTIMHMSKLVRVHAQRTVKSVHCRQAFEWQRAETSLFNSFTHSHHVLLLRCMYGQ